MKVMDPGEIVVVGSTPEVRSAVPADPRKDFFLHALLVVVVAALLVAYFAPNKPEHFVRSDSGVFVYAGQRVLAGDTLYRDVWDHKPPLVFYFNALGLALGGGSPWGVWALASFGVLIALWLISTTARDAFGDWPAALATVTFGAAVIWPMEFANATEVWGLPFQALVFYCCSAKRLQSIWTFTAGVAVGVLFCLQQNLIGVGIAAGLVILVHIDRRRPSAAFKSCAVLVAGSMVPLAAFSGYFVLRGNFGEMYDAAFRFNFEYSATTWGTRLGSLIPGITVVSGAGALLPALAGLCFALVSWFQRQSSQVRLLTMLAMADLSLEVLFSCVSGKGLAHYFITWGSSLAVLAGYFGYVIVRFSSSEPLTIWSRRTTAASVMVAALTVVMAFALLRAAAQKQLWRPDDAGRGALAAQIASELTPADRLYVWGYAPELYVMSGHASPTRFFMATPLRWRKFTDHRMASEIVASLKNDPPRMIVDSAYAIEPNYPPLDAAGRAAWTATHPTNIETLEPLFAFVDSRYSARRVGRWVVYERNR